MLRPAARGKPSILCGVLQRADGPGSLPVLGEDITGRKAMILREEQIQRYFPHLQARGWHLKPGEPSATLEKRFEFGTEDKLAGWTAEMLAYMQRAKVRTPYPCIPRSTTTRCSTMPS